MQEHYKLRNKQYSNLAKKGVTDSVMLRSIPLFDPFDTGQQINHIGLMYYLDEKGDFNEPPKLPHKILARAVFKRLSQMQQLEIYSYIDFLDDEVVELKEQEEADKLERKEKRIEKIKMKNRRTR